VVFHLRRVYGGKRKDATAVVDAVFREAALEFPEVFGADSRNEVVRQAKFEAVCVVLARNLAGVEGQGYRAVLEEMVDRIEIGLREAGVGDIKVGKEVRMYAAALNGRLGRYIPLILQGDVAGLAAAAVEHGVGGGSQVAW
jgi:hypothetical protein